MHTRILPVRTPGHALRIAILLATALAVMLAGTGCTTAPPTPGTQKPPTRPALKPLPLKPINLKTECEFRDEENGYQVAARLNIANSQVRTLHTTFTVPDHGNCSLDLSQFRQTRQRPQIELYSGNDCKIMIWEQENQITVALNQCAAYCTHDTFDYIWPIIVNKQTGTCH